MKRILSILAVLAVAVNMVGCTPSDTAAPVEAAEQVVEETAEAAETSSPTSSENTQLITEFEITDWTMEELVSDMVVDNHTFSLPCSLSEIFDSISMDNVKAVTYNEAYNTTSCYLFFDDQQIATIYFDGELNKDNLLNAKISKFFIGGALVDIPNFNVMGITNKSTREDVISILGSPNMYCENDRQYRYGFSENEFIMIDFNEENPDEIYLFFIIYNMED